MKETGDKETGGRKKLCRLFANFALFFASFALKKNLKSWILNLELKIDVVNLEILKLDFIDRH